VKAAIARAVSAALTSPRLRDARRGIASLGRRWRGDEATVHCFHQVDDPYSHLLLQALPRLARRYEVRLALHLVPPPDDAAAPDRERLAAWSRRDAQDLAEATGLVFVDRHRQPAAEAVGLAGRVMTAAIQSAGAMDAKLAALNGASHLLWGCEGQGLERLQAADAAQTDAALASGVALRRKLGHYLGVTLWFESEWYWGVDRLELLERRLCAIGLGRDPAAAPIVRVPRVECRHRPVNGHRPALDFFCSLRSPYTYLAVPRVVQLAETYGAALRIRFVLPMVMRGLPVPRAKRLYILRDAKREAEVLGMPFGRIVDPVGAPTERGLAVLHHAIPVGKGPPLLESFMRGVWAEGVDAGSERGLRMVAARAGLDASFVAAALADESWREVAQANRKKMLELGLWGVPSFRVDACPARWGQDRLWRVERDLASVTAATPADRA
jgi:2-hydroxychromene-2-carboxylate isomerase